ncbi:MAG: hypothetical protein ABSG03_24275 [Bryobacteraceae bacterium]
MSLAKELLTALVALSLAATASAQIRSATITGAVTDQSGAVAANAEVVITNSGTTEQTARVDVILKVGAAWAAAEVAQATQNQATQNQADSSAATNATYAQVINDVPNVTQNPLFYAMLQNGVQPCNETSTSTLGDL